MNKKSFVLEFIKKQELAVIATVNVEGKPEDAVIGFGQTDDFELIFGTYNSSRKYKNLKNNPQAALVIGWDENITVQYEGIASELTGGEKDKYTKIYFAKNPSAEEYSDHPDERYFKIVPKWIRYADLNKAPWEIIELKF